MSVQLSTRPAALVPPTRFSGATPLHSTRFSGSDEAAGKKREEGKIFGFRHSLILKTAPFLAGGAAFAATFLKKGGEDAPPISMVARLKSAALTGVGALGLCMFAIALDPDDASWLTRFIYGSVGHLLWDYAADLAYANGHINWTEPTTLKKEIGEKAYNNIKKAVPGLETVLDRMEGLQNRKDGDPNVSLTSIFPRLAAAAGYGLLLSIGGELLERLQGINILGFKPFGNGK